LYADRVLIRHQVSDSALRGIPRGNLSDLYPRWMGARDLLLHGRDPYSPEVTREIQTGYYGRPLDSSRPADPIDQQAFAYPLYVVFYLAPTVQLRFGIVQRAFFWILVSITAASVLFWLRMLGWRAAPCLQAAMLALSLGNLPVLQALKLQQLTLLVAALCAAAMALLVAGHPLTAGILLALATIKPQLVAPLLLWLGLWSLGDLRQRYRWAVSFLAGMAILCTGSEWLLPHWIGRFHEAVLAYQQYAQAIPTLEALLPSPWGRLVEVLFAAMTAALCLKGFRQPQNTREFQACTCLVLSVSVLVVPKFALYNHVLLIPALLFIARDRAKIWEEGGFVVRSILIAVAALLTWPWFSSVVLAGLSYILRQQSLELVWASPLWTLPQLPSAVAALMLLYTYQRTFAAPPKPGSS